MKDTPQPRGKDEALDGPEYMEPSGSPRMLEADETMGREPNLRRVRNSSATHSNKEPLRGMIQLLGDFIDTDAVSSPRLREKSCYFLKHITQLAPAEFLIGMKDNEASGLHCLEFTHPEFRNRAKDGFSILVAGKGFGCGSSREQAVMALLGRVPTFCPFHHALEAKV